MDDTGLGTRIASVAWSARYPLQHRLAAHFRSGRLYLVGDAAHAFSPATGQGMNTGIQDALNLGWKLAFAASASDPTGLLESYERERRPVARRMLALTNLAFWAEAGTGLLPELLRGVLAPLGAPAVPTLVANVGWWLRRSAACPSFERAIDRVRCLLTRCRGFRPGRALGSGKLMNPLPPMASRSVCMSCSLASPASTCCCTAMQPHSSRRSELM